MEVNMKHKIIQKITSGLLAAVSVCALSLPVFANGNIAVAEENTVIPQNERGNVMLVSDDGTPYYWCTTSESSVFCTLDENGKRVDQYEFKHYINDEGDEISLANPDLRQFGDDLYLFYSETQSWTTVQSGDSGQGWTIAKGSAVNGLKCIKLDKELKKQAEYDFSKLARSSQFIDTDGEKVCYVKGDSKIYTADMNGKNKKLIYALTKPNDFIESIAINGEYAVFAAKGTGGRRYIGAVDLNTGKAQLKNVRNAEFPRRFGDRILVYGGSVKTDQSITHFSDGELYIFSDGKFTTLKTFSADEANYLHTTMDSEGRIITLVNEYTDGKFTHTVRVYKDGTLAGETSFESGAMVSFEADGGTAAFSYVKNEHDSKVCTLLLSYGENED